MQQRMQPLRILVVRPGLEILPLSMCFCSVCTCEYAASRARLVWERKRATSLSGL